MSRLRAFVPDVVVGAAALVALVVTALRWSPGELPASWPLLLLAVPVAVVMARFPIVIVRGPIGIEIGLDPAVLVFLVLVAPRTSALLIWTLANVVTQLTNRRSPRIRFLNAGLCTAAGWAAVEVIYAVGNVGTTSPRELAAITVGAIVYFAVDYLLTSFTVAVMRGQRLRDSLWDATLPLTLGCFAAVSCLGYLGALVGRTAVWAMPLVAVPLAAVVAAAAAFDRADKHRLRMQALFDAASDAHAAGSTAEITEAVVRQSRDVVRSPFVDLRTAPPADDELGVEIRTSEEERRWLVAAPRPTRDPFTQEDRLALEAMAAVAGESLGRARVVADMAHLAGHDPLTGLANRTQFRQQVETALASGSSVAVLFCDLDGFKAVNDSLGHDAGDELLVTVARRLAATVRPGDVVARLGGDEFAVLMLGSGTEHEATAVGERLVGTLAQPVVIRQARLTIGCSVGVAVSAAGEDATVLLRNSDVAMYAAKSAGKNRVAVFTPDMLTMRVERVTLERELRTAIEHGQLALQYQPVIQLDTGRVDGVEALVRWHHPTRGVLRPADFVPLAEDTGVVGDLGSWVLERAHADAVRFAEFLGRPLSLGVNVSGCQLSDERLQRAVQRLAAHPAVQLLLEITEGTLVLAMDDAPRLERLRQLGARLAVDDFGTGYSSLAYLRDLPIDVLKLDRAFVSGIDTDPRGAGLARAIADMARTLDLPVVAEGIEDAGQLAVLRELGCQLGQGYHFAGPMWAEDVLAYLARQATATPLATAR